MDTLVLGPVYVKPGSVDLTVPKTHFFPSQGLHAASRVGIRNTDSGARGAGNVGSGYLSSLLSPLPHSFDDLPFPEVGGDLGNVRTFPRKMRPQGDLPAHGRTPAPVFCNVALIEITLTL